MLVFGNLVKSSSLYTMKILPGLVFTIFILSFFQAEAQLTALDAQNNLLTAGQSLHSTGVVRTFNNSYQGVKGSPYLNRGWYPGIMILESGDTISNQGINYDAYHDEVNYLNRLDNAPLFLPGKKIRAFYINSEEYGLQRFERREFQHKNKDQSGFFQILVQEEGFEIIRRYRTVFFQNQASGPYKMKLHDEFSPVNQYYMIKSGEVILLPKKPGALAKKLGIPSKPMFDLVYKNELDLKKHDDYMKAIKLFLALRNSAT